MVKDLLGPWRPVFESLQERAESFVPIEPTAPAVGGAAVKDRDDEDSDPLDPRLMSSRKEPDLKPPDRREVWRAIRKEAELEGDFNIVQRLHSALACPVISVFGFGLGSPHTSNLLSSVMKSYALCLRDCKTLAQLTSTQHVMWMGF